MPLSHPPSSLLHLTWGLVQIYGETVPDNHHKSLVNQHGPPPPTPRNRRCRGRSPCHSWQNVWAGITSRYVWNWEQLITQILDITTEVASVLQEHVFKTKHTWVGPVEEHNPRIRGEWITNESAWASVNDNDVSGCLVQSGGEAEVHWTDDEHILRDLWTVIFPDFPWIKVRRSVSTGKAHSCCCLKYFDPSLRVSVSIPTPNLFRIW